MHSQKVITSILMLVVMTLAIVVVSVVGVMLIALFDDHVDNNEIFKTIGPAFNMIVGAFVGLIGGITINRRKDPPQDTPQ